MLSVSAFSLSYSLDMFFLEFLKEFTHWLVTTLSGRLFGFIIVYAIKQ